MAHATRNASLALEAQKWYGRTLARLKTEIERIGKGKHESVVLTGMLVGFYEVSVTIEFRVL